jgi:hypothetical protein
MHSHTTVIVPLHFRVILVRSLNGAEFSIRLAEVSQTFHPISASQFLAAGWGLRERRPAGTVRIGSRSAMR